MKLRSWIIAGSLSLLIAATVGGWVVTREQPQAAANGQETAAGAPKKGRQPRMVDTQSLTTARKLAAMATLPEEQTFAEEAVRLANHSVDLAFTDLLRRITENPPPVTPEIKQFADAKIKAEAAVEDDERLVKQLTQKLATASDVQKESLGDQLDVAKAQLELDQDELDDAAVDLEKAGGDPQARIKRLKAAHEAADKAVPIPAATAGAARFSESSLLGRFGAWNALRTRQSQLEEARAEALATAQRIEGFRTRFSARVKQEADARQAAKQTASGFARTGTSATAASSKDAAKANLASLKHFLSDQKLLTDMGKRIQDEHDLADVYGNWDSVLEPQGLHALHRVLESALTILAILAGVLLGGRLVDRFFRKTGHEDLRTRTLDTVVTFALRAVGLLTILFVVIGVPSQTTTILGLAGAGLTVAMKDFIVAFFGWFVLMGRNGIRVGDWVEIKGVGGEVAEIGLLRTVILETGSWNDAGHPTGRRVAFVNSFAIEGHFFNFTTSGQWMWDELQVLIPAGQDPYPVIDGMRKLVERETETNAKLAEQEWQKATRSYRVKAFSALPGLQVVPTSAGMEIHVRYITRAYERHETRKSLYQAVLELMHGKPVGGLSEGPADA